MDETKKIKPNIVQLKGLARKEININTPLGEAKCDPWRVRNHNSDSPSNLQTIFE